MLSVILSIAGVAVVVAALIWSTNRQVGVVLHALRESQPRDTPAEPQVLAYDTEYFRRIEEVERNISELYKAVADGIDHVDRNEKRVRGIVLGAKRRFEASDYYDPGVDAEADTLPEDDARPFPDQEVLPLQTDVEPDIAHSPWSAVPGRIDHA